jgi:branched-chain amino acid transport system permease protein
MPISRLLQPVPLVGGLVFLGLALVPVIAGLLGEPYYLSLVGRFLVYAIAASALNLILGYGGLVSLGHALFMGLGVYGVAIASHYGLDSGLLHLALGLAACALIGLLTGAVSLRTTGIGFIMITLAFSQMGYYLFVSLRAYGGDDGMPVVYTSRIGGLDLGNPASLYWVAFVLLVALTCWSARLRTSPFGMVLRGAARNAPRVQALGLPVFRYRLAGYVLSAMICGVAGLLLANLSAYASPSTLVWNVSGELIVRVVRGGMGTVFGPVLGAVLFLSLEELLKAYTDHWMAGLGLAITLMALLGHGGLVGLLSRLRPRPAAPVPVQMEGGQP